MYNYIVVIKYSRDGVVWNQSTIPVRADSETDAERAALRSAPSGYKYVEVISVRRI